MDWFSWLSSYYEVYDRARARRAALKVAMSRKRRDRRRRAKKRNIGNQWN